MTSTDLAPRRPVTVTGVLDDPELGFEVTRLDDLYDKCDFAETAAVMANLDLIISCDTAAAHLAGAIGKPVWIAVNRVSDWRWMEEREDTIADFCGGLRDA